MTERRHAALQQAYDEIPKRKSEDHPLIHLVPTAGVLVTHGVAVEIFDTYQELIVQNRIGFAFVGVALYGISRLADIHSTKKALTNQQHAERYGIEGEHKEINPQLFGARIPKEIKINKTLVAFEILATALSALSPVFASSFITGSFLDAKSNYRIARRYERAAQIAQSQQ